MVIFGFYLLSSMMFFSVFVIINKSDEKQKLSVRYGIVFLAWILYITTISNLGLLDSFDLPPRIPLMVVIPSIILILFITSRNAVKKSIAIVSRSFAIYIQAFRIGVELLIYGAFLNGVFPKNVTFEGINFDIIVGVSALLVGYLVQRKIMGRIGVLIWNFSSLAILSVTVYAFISTYYFNNFSTTIQSIQFVKMPYLLLASVLLPFAVFYHVVSIRQHFTKKLVTNDIDIPHSTV